MKRCSKCVEEKSEEAFYVRRRRGREELQGWCKACQKKIFKQDYDQATTEQRWKSVFSSRRSVAKKLGIPFTITFEDATLPDRCPVFGTAFKCGTLENRDVSPSLDRIKPELGYVPDNVIVVSWRANNIKGDASWEEILRVGEFYRNLSTTGNIPGRKI